MPRDAIQNVSLRSRAWCYFRLVYKELQYWFVGLTPESYHLHQARVWGEMHAYRRVIAHMKSYLKNTENAKARWNLAYYLGCVEEWSQAALEYGKVAGVLPQPALRLGQDELRNEFRLGT
jgi:hypothetical protein